MKPRTPHDPLDDLIAAALHGELTPAERTDFDNRLQHDPAARAAYQETQRMHDLLEKTHREAQPDAAFEQRMVSGVRRKIQAGAQPRETAWESVLALWKMTLGGYWLPRVAIYGGLAAVLVLSFLHPAVTAALREPQVQLRNTASAWDNNFQEKDKGVQAMQKSIFAPPGGRLTRMGDATIVSTDDSNSVVASAAVPSMTMAPPRNAPMAPADVDSPSNELSGRAMKKESFDGVARIVNTAPTSAPSMPAPAPPALTPEVTRKLIRNAQLDLEVKSFQAAVDQIAAMTKGAGGYVDTSNSQRGGNGKLQGTVVVKVLPENLDAFLLKLRDVGTLKNQSVSTDDVTKQYVDTQARLDNARRMEAQLQDLLKRDNGKVSELLQVERELGRVRGEIEQMQGELKLYDFQVEYATVTLNVAEKDLDQAAAYLLKETDEFSLFAGDVESAFAQARQAADAVKGHVLEANLEHNSGTDVSATLSVSVPPEQIEPFLAQVKALGRIDNFTRQTQRVARDGGDTDQPADQTLTEKDRVLVHLTIHSDDESPLQQTALSVLSSDVDAKAQQLKKDAAAAGVQVQASSFERQDNGQELAQLTFRLPQGKYAAFVADLEKLGKVESLTVHREDKPDSPRTDDNAPVEISLNLHSEGPIVADNNGVWATLRRMLGEGTQALLNSVWTIGVMIAFLIPWAVLLTVLAWVGRRIYVWRMK